MAEPKDWPPGSGEWRLDRAQEIRDLVDRLARTQAAIQKLIAGQADAVVDPRSGALILLQAAQSALQESEARYDRLADRLGAVIFEFDPDGGIIFVSDTVKRIVGYTVGELRKRDWRDLLFPAERRQEIGRLIQDVQTRDLINQEVLVRNRAGDDVMIDVSTANRYQDGKLTRIIGMALDITERKRKENELRQAAVLFDNTPNGVMITDREGRIVRVNKAFTTITGYGAEEAIGKRPPIVKSGRQDPPFYRDMWKQLTEQGQWSGEIWNRRKVGDIYPAWETITAVKDEAGNTTNYVGVFTDITTIKASEERLEYLAHHDALTGAANRLLFKTTLERMIRQAGRQGGRFALLYLDLDRFKSVNDLYGHEYGDIALTLIADRMRHAIRADDLLARVGGDEFVVVMDAIKDSNDAAILANKIIGAVSQPMQVIDKEVQIGISAGISIFPDDAQEADLLIKAADAAMFLAKEQGKRTYEFSTAELTRKSAEYFWYEANLSRALPTEQFFIEYQPQVSLKSGHIVGAEALVRWHHPEMGVLLPEKFISVAEDSGIINELGEWVMRTACAEAAQWKKPAPFRLAINISGRQLLRNPILDRVPDILRETGLPPENLELEFTESVLQRSPPPPGVMRALRELGICFAIDDFGTGYSSLSMIKHLPVETLKIDHSFVADLPGNADNEAITTAIIAMGHGLRQDVIAEGAENYGQVEFLRSHGCDTVQGFVFSSPVAPPQMREWLAANKQFALAR